VVAEEPAQANLIDHRLLQEPIAGAHPDELMEVRVQLEELQGGDLLETDGEQIEVLRAQALCLRPLKDSTGLAIAAHP